MLLSLERDDEGSVTHLGEGQKIFARKKDGQRLGGISASAISSNFSCSSKYSMNSDLLWRVTLVHATAFCGGQVCGGTGVSPGDRQEARREQKETQNYTQLAPTHQRLTSSGCTHLL